MTDKECCSKEDKRKIDILLGDALFNAATLKRVLDAVEVALTRELTLQEIAFAISRTTRDCPAVVVALLSVINKDES